MTAIVTTSDEQYQRMMALLESVSMPDDVRIEVIRAAIMFARNCCLRAMGELEGEPAERADAR